MGLAGAIARETTGLLFPLVCLLCEGRIAHGGLCTVCLEGLKRVPSPRCSVCGAPFSAETGPDRPCAQCLMKSPPFVRLTAALSYDDAASRAVHRFKYHGETSLAVPFGAIMAGALGRAESFDLIVPVPLHRKRLRHRGFNQSLLLARELSRRTGIELDYRRLGRMRHTLPQVDLKEDERRSNVKGAFEVKDVVGMRGKGVLLVDDVYTTGATVRECSLALKKAGAVVHVLTLARAHKV